MKARKFPKGLPLGEHRLLTTARMLLSTGRGRGKLLLAERPQTIPMQISPSASILLRETLARGGIRQLALLGGWHDDMSMTAEGVVRRGRLWERHVPLPPLRFGEPSFALCRWLASGKADDQELLALDSLASGDDLLLHLALLQNTK